MLFLDGAYLVDSHPPVFQCVAPRYPGELVNLALRLGVNIAMCAMTH